MPELREGRASAERSNRKPAQRTMKSFDEKLLRYSNTGRKKENEGYAMKTQRATERSTL